MQFQKKCYEECPPKSQKSKEKEFFCDAICDEENPYELIETQKCVDYCDIDLILSGLCITKYKVNKKEQINNKSEKEIKEEEIKQQDKFLNNIEKSFTSKNFNSSSLDVGKDESIQCNDITITLTTSDNQKDDKNIIVTMIDLGECETISPI